MNTPESTLTLVVFLLFAHYVGDCIVQTRKQANGKSTSLIQLISHVSTYTVSLMVLIFIGNFTNFSNQFSLLDILVYGGANFVLHFITDYFTSRKVTDLWTSNKEHATFAVMGLDQFIHAVCLLSTIQLLTKG